MDEQLKQVLLQLQDQHVAASRQLNALRQQLAAREREKKASALTLREIESLPRGGEAPAMYMGVGKMFMQESRNSVENGLKTRSKEVEGELSTIVKRIKQCENEQTTAQNSLRDVLQTAQRAQAQQS